MPPTVTDGYLLLIAGVIVIIAGFAWTLARPASPGVLLLVLGFLVVAWGAVARHKSKKMAERDAAAHA